MSTKQIALRENRVETRGRLSLTMMIKGHTGNGFWKETTTADTISRLGAGFSLERECQIGQLVSFIIQMPSHLRSYDPDSELYRIWGIVQHCTPVKLNESTGFMLGAAFIGKYPPASYKENPFQSYQIIGNDEETGLWRVEEVSRSFITRRHPRFWRNVEVRLSHIGADDKTTTEETITQNISMKGVSVISNIAATSADKVIFSCPEFDYETIAVVRNRQTAENQSSTLHLEFTEKDFPIREFLMKTEEMKQTEPEEEAKPEASPETTTED